MVQNINLSCKDNVYIINELFGSKKYQIYGTQYIFLINKEQQGKKNSGYLFNSRGINILSQTELLSCFSTVVWEIGQIYLQ